MPPVPALLGVLALLSCVSAQRPLNLLFYGNSYSADNASVPAFVGVIAEASGLPVPRIVARLVGGTNLTFHQTDPAQVAAISTSLPPGEHWDFVVLQGLSTESNSVIGNPERFRAAAVGIVANVRAHSPNARAVLYQTWARAQGHSFYPVVFPNPMAMHREVRTNYELAAADIDRAFGPGTARLARVGDVVASLAFSPAVYHADLAHPGLPITMSAAMAIYSALWLDAVCHLSPAFTQQTSFGRHCIGNGFTPQMWKDVRGYADLVRAPSTRPTPGSGEDLLLGTRRNGAPPCTCWQFGASIGDTLDFELWSPNGAYASAPSAVLLGLPSGSPVPGYPELWVGLRPYVVLGASPTLGTGLRVTARVPANALHAQFVLQGLAAAPSANTGRGFTTTEAQKLRIE